MDMSDLLDAATLALIGATFWFSGRKWIAVGAWVFTALVAIFKIATA